LLLRAKLPGAKRRNYPESQRQSQTNGHREIPTACWAWGYARQSNRPHP
jgi:hypothetical protein